ncbi:hypothetical protein DLM78_16845 [Leptospira stimsonii]|uniref:Uncharacterized protein n=1 Tax=Leptospira stimsonii TaxID=2202203 RepID=A0A8B3CPZ5_9LEPT|nr:hypothetical protein DLM78_16845 [Leptospira stimsonii]
MSPEVCRSSYKRNFILRKVEFCDIGKSPEVFSAPDVSLPPLGFWVERETFTERASEFLQDSP